MFAEKGFILPNADCDIHWGNVDNGIRLMAPAIADRIATGASLVRGAAFSASINLSAQSIILRYSEYCPLL